MKPNWAKLRAPCLGAGAVGLTLILGPSLGAAQTISRKITNEPVETTVTQYPDGTEVTRRILSPEPTINTAVPLGTPAPLSGDALTPRYVEPKAPPLARRPTITTPSTVGEATRATPRHTTRARTLASHTTPSHTAAIRAAASRPATSRGIPARIVGPATVAPPPLDAALVLNPAQRQIIYRTVVQPRYGVPPAEADYPLRAVYPTDNGYPYAPAPNYSYASPYYGATAYAETNPDFRDPYHTAYRWDGVPLLVGARMPASVPLVLMPQPVVATVPVTRAYSYAVLDNHVYLVDPATRVIVAEVTQ